MAGGIRANRYLEDGSKVLIIIFPNETDAFILEGAYVLGSLFYYHYCESLTESVLNRKSVHGLEG